jgi:poly-beta-1,6-N-acetyl-D-glucosamine synthase
VTPRVLLVSPVRNEAAHIERVVRAMAAQTHAPARWIVVDDRSDDATLEILRRLEPQVPFMDVIEGPGLPAAPRDRLALAAEARAFNHGLEHAALADYTHVGKFDGDVELPPDYLERILDRLAQDPELGMAGGELVEPRRGSWKRIRIPDYHVHGAMKLYTRECFTAIGGIQERLAWDTIDETYARMRGYRTQTFGDLEGRHHRPMASADGQLRGWARFGECAWILHYSAPWVLMRSAKVAAGPPPLLAGAAFVWGYVRSALRRVERVPDPAFRAFTRAELRARIRRSLRLRCAAAGQRRPHGERTTTRSNGPVRERVGPS